MVKIFCPACDAETSHDLLFKKNGSEIQRCNLCGLGRADASDFLPEAYYTGDYFNGGHDDGYADYAGSEGVIRSEFSRNIHLLGQYCKPGGKLLEIGCAYGFFLMEARVLYDVYGIEVSAEAVDVCHSAGLVTVQQGVADETALARVGEVDVIAMFDVLEHLPDPTETLQHCNRILRPGGVIVLTTGDFSSPVARLMGSHWRLMTPPQHLWFFSQVALGKIADSLGLNLVSCTKPWKRVPFSLILYQLARMLGFKQKSAGLARFSRFGIPVNLYDSMRIVFHKPAEGGN